MLKCPKCGTDNLLTAIFCRGCGEKMNIDELKPEDFFNTKKSAKELRSEKMNRIAGYILSGVAVIFLIGLLIPACGTIKPCDPMMIDQKLIDEYEMIKSRTVPEGGLVFTNQEVTDIVNWRLSQYTGNAGIPRAAGVSIKMHDNHVVDAVVSARLLFLPFSVTCQLQSFNGFWTDYTTNSARAGIWPIPKDLRKYVLGNFGIVFRNQLNELSSPSFLQSSMTEDSMKIVQIAPPKPEVKEEPKKKSKK